MKLRRGLAVLTVAALLGACGESGSPLVADPSATTTEGPATATTEVQSATTTPATSTTAPVDTNTARLPVPPPPGVRSCTSSDVDVVLGFEIGGALGHGFGQLIVTNLSRSACVVFDDITITGHRLTGEAEAGRRKGAHVPVNFADPVLDVGEAVGVTVQWSNVVPPADPARRYFAITVVLGGDEVGAHQIQMEMLDGFSFQSPTEVWSDYEPSVIVTPRPGAAGTPIAVDDTLTTAGMAAIVAGSSVAEVADATGQTVVVTEWGAASPGCGYARLAGTSSVLLYLNGPGDDVADAVVTAVEIARVLGGDHRTPSGLHPGSSEQALFDALGTDRLTPTLNEYTDTTEWRFTPADADEQHLGMFFRMTDGTIQSIIGGLASDIYRGEGCA